MMPLKISIYTWPYSSFPLPPLYCPLAFLVLGFIITLSLNDGGAYPGCLVPRPEFDHPFNYISHFSRLEYIIRQVALVYTPTIP